MMVPKVYSEVIYYVLIPIFIVMLVFGLAIIIVSYKDREHVDLKRRFKMNYWSAVVGIIFGAMLLAVSLGFSVAFIGKMYASQLTQIYPLVLVILAIFPFIPLGFLIYCIVKLIKVLNHKNEIIVEVE